MERLRVALRLAVAVVLIMGLERFAADVTVVYGEAAVGFINGKSTMRRGARVANETPVLGVLSAAEIIALAEVAADKACDAAGFRQALRHR